MKSMQEEARDERECSSNTRPRRPAPCNRPVMAAAADGIVPNRAGSFHAGVTGCRRLKAENWRFERRAFEIDAQGVAIAVYTTRTALVPSAYSLVAFAQNCARTTFPNRVMHRLGHDTFNLFDGLPNVTRHHPCRKRNIRCSHRPDGSRHPRLTVFPRETVRWRRSMNHLSMLSEPGRNSPTGGPSMQVGLILMRHHGGPTRLRQLVLQTPPRALPTGPSLPAPFASRDADGFLDPWLRAWILFEHLLQSPAGRGRRNLMALAPPLLASAIQRGLAWQPSC